MPSVKAIIPKRGLLEPKKLARAIENALDGAAKAAKADFGVTVQTWETEVEFEIKRQPGRRRIFTTNAVYRYVSEGTRAHRIEAKGKKPLAFPQNFGPKTVVRQIASGAGGRGGPTVYTRAVEHPGTEARKFDEAVAEKWQKELPKTLQRAIDAEFG